MLTPLSEFEEKLGADCDDRVEVVVVVSVLHHEGVKSRELPKIATLWALHLEQAGDELPEAVSQNDGDDEPP